MKAERKVELVPVSARGDQIIKQWANLWTIEKAVDSVAFSSESGPWLLIHAVSDMGERSKRWVHLNNDKHFIVVEVS